MKAVILAAGYATRLYPLTKNKPKPLLPIAGEPIIDHILKRLKATGSVKEIIVISNNRFFAMYQRWLKRAAKKFPRFSFTLLNDGSDTLDDRLGAVGDIEFAIAKAKIKEDILVIGGDNIFGFSLEKFFVFAKRKRPAVSFGVFDIEDITKASRFGVVQIDRKKKVISFEEKPQHPRSSLIATCIYYFPAASFRYIFDYIRRGLNKDASGRYIRWLCAKKSVYGFVFKGMWHDIGHLDYYRRLKKEFHSPASTRGGRR